LPADFPTDCRADSRPIPGRFVDRIADGISSTNASCYFCSSSDMRGTNLERRPSNRVEADFSGVDALGGFRRRFRALGNATRAAREKAYLKSTLRFHGVTVPQVRQTALAWAQRHPALTRGQLRALADALFATDYHDLRSLGIAVLERKKALLGPADLPWLVGHVRTTANWAHVDWLATKVIGPLVAALPAARRKAQLRRWARDPHLWIRRTALLAQHDVLRAGGGDFPLFAAIAAPLLPEREFFIRKAIGWILREVGKRRPELTFAFLKRHRARVAGLTFREGSKHLPAAMRAALAAVPAARPITRRRRPDGRAPRPASARAERER
jgi:3-methyladenine DNA glycosylase AlkD